MLRAIVDGALLMGKSSSPPPPPDYVGAAREQSALSRELTAQQTFANRPNITTPFGSQIWDVAAGTDPSTGLNVPLWSSNITLGPEQQAAADAQQRIRAGRSQGAETLLGQAVSGFQTPQPWQDLPTGAPSINAGDFFGGSDFRQRAQSAVEQLQAPDLAQRRELAESQLANQGITRGSEAWQNAQRGLGDQETRAQLAAIAAGQQEAQLQGNLGSQALAGNVQAGSFNNANRQQGIAEQALRRGSTLNELNALLSGQQVSLPTMPSFTPAQGAQSPQLLAASGLQGQAANDRFNAEQANNAALQSGLFSLGSAMLGGFGFGSSLLGGSGGGSSLFGLGGL